MKKVLKVILHMVSALLITVLANSVIISRVFGGAGFLWLCIPLYIVINIVPSVFNRDKKTLRLSQMADGCELLRLFILSTVLSIMFVATMLCCCPILEAKDIWSMTSNEITFGAWVWNIVLIIVVEAMVFWNGIIRVYLTSTQLGIRWRVLGAVCGMIPIANLVLLRIIIKTVEKEVRFENDKILLNEKRKAEQICQTKYPLLMVHGVFFRDFRYLNYWGRIPEELIKNGATIYYGNQQSAASVEECGKELAGRIEQIVKETGCEKVNIIAHSKGGLDSRYAISLPGVAEHVASLTTINTPHKGCEFADYLLSKIPVAQKEMIAKTYNAALCKLGDKKPDFLSAVYDLTADACRKRDEELTDMNGIYCQSVGSKLNTPSSGQFPLNFTTHLVQYFDGNNDGLVGEDSFAWGENYRFLTVNGNRGISHGDMIDLNRENIEGFDVREFFVELVADLKKRGY